MEWLRIRYENTKSGEEAGGGSEKRRRSGYICDPLITSILASKFTSFCPRSDKLKFGWEGDGGYSTSRELTQFILQIYVFGCARCSGMVDTMRY